MRKLNVRYHASRLLPMPFRSTHAQTTFDSEDVQAGGHGNHFRDDTHVDLIEARWWQWRGRCFHNRTVTVCVPS